MKFHISMELLEKKIFLLCNPATFLLYVIEVPVPSRRGERSCICVSIWPFSTGFFQICLNCFDNVEFCVFSFLKIL